MAGTTNLQKLLEDHPSPGITPGSVFLQDIDGTGYGILGSQLLPVPQAWNGGAYTPGKIVYLNVTGGPLWVSNGNTTASVPPAVGNAEWTGYPDIFEILTWIFLNKAGNP